MQQAGPKPLSPHLQVYRLPLTAVLSIMHRMTGVVLAFGLLLLVALLAAAAGGPGAYAVAHGLLASWWGQGLLMLWSAALYLHLCNGIRHLFWDAGLGFTLPVASRTALWVIIATAVLTALTWGVAFYARGTFA